MPLITDIKTTKKGRYALFCDGEFCFSLEPFDLVERGLEIGMELSPQQLSELSELADLQKATSKALMLVGQRPHTRLELTRKLLRQFDQYTVERVVNRIAEYGYIDDQDYASLAVSSHIARKNMSLKAASAYLRERGIDLNDPENAGLLEDYALGEQDRIAAIISKSYLAKLRDPKSRASVVAALARRGYSVRDIKSAMERFLSDSDEQDWSFNEG